MTFEELQKAGAKPVTLDALKAQGATPAGEAKPPAAPPGAGETFSRGASSFVPFGKQAEAAFNTLPIVGTGKSYSDNLADVNARTKAGEAARPVWSNLGKGTGLAASVLAPGGVPAQAALGALTAGGEANAQGKPVLEQLGAAGTGAATQGLVGPIVSKAAGAARAGLQSLGSAAEGRMVERGVNDLGVGAGKRATAAVQAKADEIGEAMADSPALRKAAEIHANTGKGAKLLEQADKLRKQGSKELAEIYNSAAAPGYRPTDYLHDTGGVPEAADDVATNPVAHKYLGPEAEAKLQAKADQPARQRPMPEPDESVTRPNVAPPSMAGPASTAPAGGVPVKSVTAKLDARISELAKGTSTERAQAAELARIRDEFAGARTGKMHPRELRAEQSDYQGQAKFGQTAAEAVKAKANAEASKAVGDALLEHVTGMGFKDATAYAEANPGSLADRILKANGKVTAASRIEDVVAARAGSNPGAPHRLTALVHGARHGGAALAVLAAGGLGHGGVGAAIVAADAALTMAPKALRKLDPQLAKLVAVGRQQGWTAPQLAAAIARGSTAEGSYGS